MYVYTETFKFSYEVGVPSLGISCCPGSSTLYSFSGIKEHILLLKGTDR